MKENGYGVLKENLFSTHFLSLLGLNLWFSSPLNEIVHGSHSMPKKKQCSWISFYARFEKISDQGCLNSLFSWTYQNHYSRVFLRWNFSLGGIFLWMPASVSVCYCYVRITPSHFTVLGVRFGSRILSDGSHPSSQEDWIWVRLLIFWKSSGNRLQCE